MDRIDGADTTDIGDGKRGFKDENVVAGVAGTEVTAAFLNALQEELLKVIVEAGIEPNSQDWTQLWQAIQIIIETYVNANSNSPAWITADTTYVVDETGFGDFLQIQEAFDFLDGVMILPSATVTIEVRDGTYQPFTANHPNGKQIKIIGAAMTGGFALADSVSDAATSKNNFDANFPTKIAAVGAVSGATVYGEGLQSIENILIKGDGSAGSIAGVALLGDMVKLKKVAVIGFEGAGGAGVATERGFIPVDNCFVSNCETGARALDNGASIHISDDTGASFFRHGVYGLISTFGNIDATNSYIQYFSNSGCRTASTGRISVTSGNISNNVINGFAANSGLVELNQCALGTVTGVASLYAVNDGKVIDTVCTGTRTASPPVHTVGNFNAYVRQS